MLPLLPFERIAKKSGVKRISTDASKELQEIISEYATETAERAVKLSKHANRRTVMLEDVRFVTKGK